MAQQLKPSGHSLRWNRSDVAQRAVSQPQAAALWRKHVPAKYRGMLK